MLGLVLFSPLGQRLCLLLEGSSPRWVEPSRTLHSCLANAFGFLWHDDGMCKILALNLGLENCFFSLLDPATSQNTRAIPSFSNKFSVSD